MVQNNPTENLLHREEFLKSTPQLCNKYFQYTRTHHNIKASFFNPFLTETDTLIERWINLIYNEKGDHWREKCLLSAEEIWGEGEGRGGERTPATPFSA